MTDDVRYGIEISVLWKDEQLLELRIRASNGVFSGQTDAYENHGYLERFANTLRGFPISLGDTRTFEIGNFDEGYAGGGAAFRFICIDSQGHSLVEVRLRADNVTRAEFVESVTVRIPFEAAAMDSFVARLSRMTQETGQSAILEAIPL